MSEKKEITPSPENKLVKLCMYVSGVTVDPCNLNAEQEKFKNQVLAIDQKGKITTTTGSELQVMEIPMLFRRAKTFLQRNIESNKIRLIVIFDPEARSPESVYSEVSKASLLTNARFIKALTEIGGQKVIDQAKKIDAEILRLHEAKTKLFD